MVESMSTMTDDLQEISEYLLYHKKRHTFCVDCLERENFARTSCKLCRPFYALSDEGLNEYSRAQCLEKLVDLHHLYGEKSLDVNVTGENRFDIPLIEQFRLRRVSNPDIEIAWLENKIYVAYFGIKRVRVFADQAPFNELPEGFEIKELDFVYGMTASAPTRSLFISDNMRSCVWVIELPNNVLKQFEVRFCPSHMSITPGDELLVVVEDERECLPPTYCSYSVSIFSLSDFSLTKSIPLPHTVEYITCAAQLPNKNIVISYETYQNMEEIWLGILSTDGEFLQNIDPNAFETIGQNPWYPEYFAIMENGDIFFIDKIDGKVYLFNSQLSDYQLISCNGNILQCPKRIVYNKERKQLLVHEDIGNASVSQLSVFHLGPCNLIQRTNDDQRVSVSKITRKRKTLDFTSKYRKLRLQKKQKLLI